MHQCVVMSHIEVLQSMVTNIKMYNYVASRHMQGLYSSAIGTYKIMHYYGDVCCVRGSKM